ncbi:MAG: hypothetical protein ACLS6O_05875 [Bifidobacterium sp.]
MDDREVQFAYNEGGISIVADDDRAPDLYSDFKNVKLIPDNPAPDGEEDLFNDLNSDSELNINSGGDAGPGHRRARCQQGPVLRRSRSGMEPEVERRPDSEGVDIVNRSSAKRDQA